MAKASRSILHRQKAFNLTESVPGLSEVPADASDEIWWKWLSRSCKCTTFFLHALNKTIFLYLLRATLDIPSPHVVGTSAMMPRSQGGVVDAHMRVYGTANVRVVDASTHPVLLGGHPMSSLYASAERISDIIKADQGISVSRATNDGLLFAYQSH
jgi:choline dehydrogenase-like flavoprotein